jgi:hypothetical protein
MLIESRCAAKEAIAWLAVVVVRFCKSGVVWAASVANNLTHMAHLKALGAFFNSCLSGRLITTREGFSFT